jgi:ABC-2 type transport system ATP-binding protein
MGVGMIEVRDVSKSFGRRQALDHLSFVVQPGMVTGFLGPNGAGKSTTMRIVLGLSRADSGLTLLSGRELRQIDQPLRTVGGLIDASWAQASRSARAHLRWIAAYNRIPFSRVDELLERTGLSSVATKRVGTFSLGMRQRLGIASALLGDPQILILDEPLNGLDPEGIAWVKELLRTLAAEGKTVFLSSHLLSEIATIVDHLVVLGQGRLVADASLGDFVGAAGVGGARVRTSDPAALGAELSRRKVAYSEAVDGIGRAMFLVDDVTTDDIGLIAAEHGIAVLELASRDMSLEQAFMDATRDDIEFASTQTRAPRRDEGVSR